MKKLCLSLALIFLTSAQAKAETSVWKAEKDGATLYLGGTIHLLRPSDFPLPPEFDTAYAASDLLVFEADIGAMSSPQVQQKLMVASMYTDGSTLADHLSPETYKQFSDFCATKGIPVSALQLFKPSMAVLTVTMMELMEIGIAPQGTDTTLHQRALRDKKPVEYLETINQQIDMLLGMGSDDPDTFVAYSLQDLKNTKRDFLRMIDAWKTGDVSGMEQFVVELLQQYPTLHKELIVDRNNAWLTKVPTWQQTPQVEFILVGVGHLIGSDGLLPALKADGWNITKLTCRP